MPAALRRIAKAVAIYSLLVVPPVAGLLAILHAGKDVRAPRSIGGDWLLSSPVPACPAFDFAGKPVTLAVSQSGLRAVGKLSDASHAALSLEISGDAVTGEQHDSSSCRVELAARLAAIGPAGDLVGVLRWPDCRGCAEQPFRASRMPHAAGAR